MPGVNLHRHVGNMQTPHTKAPLGVKRGTSLLHLNRNLSDLMVLRQPVLLPVFLYHFQNRTHSSKLKNVGNVVITLMYVCFQTASTGDEALSGRSWPVSGGSGGGNCLHKKMKINSWSFNELSWWRDHYQESEEQTWLRRGKKKSNPEENSSVHVAKILSIKGDYQFSSLKELCYS